MITERIFNIQGVGNTLYQGILRGEGTLVVSIVTIMVMIFVICNLVVDMLYGGARSAYPLRVRGRPWPIL